jgi:hypothetical protein
MKTLKPVLILALLAFSVRAESDYVWFEGEDAVEHTFPKSFAFAANTAQEKDKLSGGDWLQTDKGANVTAKWVVTVPKEGEYNFWTRKFWKHGPFKWHWNEQEPQICGSDCALADSVELRKFLCANWVYLGKTKLPAGKNMLHIQALPDAGAVAFDCFVLTTATFAPDGKNKPGQKYNRAEEGWFPFEPDADTFAANAAFDLRSLNQKRAGDDGFLKAKGMDFVFEKSGEKVKFWSVVASADYDDRAAVDYLARHLAKTGVNMVRIHSPVFDANAKDPTTLNAKHLDNVHYFVSALAKEGIYTKLSFYFPLWFDAKPADGFAGYKPGQKAYSLLFFHPRMQEIYKTWAKGLLTIKNPYTGKSLADDPAVGIVEVINEDNYFFWTFKPHETISAECMQVLEKAFGDWLTKKYSSLDKAQEAWGSGGEKPRGDDLASGRVGLYDAGHMTSQDWAAKSRNQKRAQDQVQFLTENLRGFYAGMAKYFHDDLGVKCCISATNWTTADNRVLGALDKYTNMACDVIDRHAYFCGPVETDAGYTVRKGDKYTDKTGMYGPTGLQQELQYIGHPHIVSEYSYDMPNRFRTECSFLTAAYGSLAGTDGFFFFALGTSNWLRENVKWPVYAPVTMGQFPAASIIFRKGYVKEGPVVYHAAARLADLYALKGTPVEQAQNLDELRKADIPAGGKKELDHVSAMDPLAYFVGQVTMNVADEPGKSSVMDITPFIDREKKIVKSATGELSWDWGKGVATMNAPCAQGACGFLKAAGALDLDDLSLQIENEYAAVMAVSLDGQPLKSSAKILLQIMSEDRTYGFHTQPTKVKHKDGHEVDMLEITDLGSPPIVVKKFGGSVSFKRADAASLKVTTLDANFYKKSAVDGGAAKISLQADVLYYIIER